MPCHKNTNTESSPKFPKYKTTAPNMNTRPKFFFSHLKVETSFSATQKSQIMEEILSLILQGCKLTRDLESNLSILTNNPSLLASSCEDIIRVFSGAADRLKAQISPPPPELQAGVQKWLRSSYTQSMPMAVDPFQAQLFSDKNPFDVRLLTSKDGEGSSSARSRGGQELRVAEASDAGKSPVIQRSRKRKDGVEKHTIKAAAPRIGNTEIPPDDGFTWRKYGQKEILGSRFPRSYYRCTHKSFYGCNAKKQVQRLDDDPDTFEVTYCGHHTCLMSSTAPSGTPPVTTQPEPTEVEPTQSSLPLRRWRSLEFEPSSSTDLRLRTGNFNVAGGTSSNVDAAATEGQGPSQPQARDGKEAEWPVVDLADAMFNSGSSSSSMDAIFSFMQDK